MLEYVLYYRHYFHSLSFAKIQFNSIRTKKKGDYFNDNGNDNGNKLGFRRQTLDFRL